MTVAVAQAGGIAHSEDSTTFELSDNINGLTAALVGGIICRDLLCQDGHSDLPSPFRLTG